MSELISGKEALIALANGEYLQQQNINGEWSDIRRDISWRSILGDNYKLRLKPSTITINGIEVPAPFEPRADDCRVYVIDTRNVNGYDWQHSSNYNSNHVVWRTEEEVKQVVAALRSVFGKK